MSDKPSTAWYLAPIFLGIIGSAIMWYVLKDEDHPDSPKMIKKGWVIGIVLTLIPLLMMIPMIILVPMTTMNNFDEMQDHMGVIPDPIVQMGVIPDPIVQNVPAPGFEDVLDIAQKFVKSSPTFAFDGIQESLEFEFVAIRESFPEQYVIQADFDSLHEGYGDRTAQMLDQAITPHSMNLVIINGEVRSAVLDGKWDELNQHQLPWSPTKGSDKISSHENVEEFSLVYTKEGGIAGISESIIINSSEKMSIKRTAQGQTEILLNKSQINLLLNTINDGEFLRIGSLVYAPSEGWTDYFTYTLRIMSGDVESNITWTDTSNVPQDLVLISQQIEGTITNDYKIKQKINEVN